MRRKLVATAVFAGEFALAYAIIAYLYFLSNPEYRLKLLLETARGCQKVALALGHLGIRAELRYHALIEGERTI